MSAFIHEELRLLLTAVISGVVFRACYDVQLIYRGLFHPGNLVTGIGDVVYWLSGCMVTFRMLYYANDGIVRGFILLGMLFGMLLYHFLVSVWLVKRVCRICSVTGNWINSIFKKCICRFRKRHCK